MEGREGERWAHASARSGWARVRSSRTNRSRWTGAFATHPQTDLPQDASESERRRWTLTTSVGRKSERDGDSRAGGEGGTNTLTFQDSIYSERTDTWASAGASPSLASARRGGRLRTGSLSFPPPWRVGTVLFVPPPPLLCRIDYTAATAARRTRIA